MKNFSPQDLQKMNTPLSKELLKYYEKNYSFTPNYNKNRKILEKEKSRIEDNDFDYYE